MSIVDKLSRVLKNKQITSKILPTVGGLAAAGGLGGLIGAEIVRHEEESGKGPIKTTTKGVSGKVRVGPLNIEAEKTDRSAGIGPAKVRIGGSSRTKVTIGPFTYDSEKGTIRWDTFKGGPVLEGPSEVMLDVIRKGQENKQEGIATLVRYMRVGAVRKVGVVE